MNKNFFTSVSLLILGLIYGFLYKLSHDDSFFICMNIYFVGLLISVNFKEKDENK